jgi:hypothetical protein
MQKPGNYFASNSLLLSNVVMRIIIRTASLHIHVERRFLNDNVVMGSFTVCRCSSVMGPQ